MAKLGDFRVYHPEYDSDFWAKARAFYAGGQALLADDDLLNEVFPKHYGEDPDVYEERKARAFYEPYSGEIVDKIVANVFSQKVTVGTGSQEPFYDRFYQDVSRPGGHRCSLNDFLKHVLLESLITKKTWVQVALPKPQTDSLGNEIEFQSREQQEAAGALDAFLLVQKAENIINWKLDADENIQWLVSCREEDTRSTFDASQTLVRYVYTVWTPETWTEYVFEWDTEKEGEDPNDEMEPISVKSDFHTFGAVPFIPFHLPAGLWAMGKLESLARVLFNLHNGLAWAECRNLYPILAVFLQQEEAMNPVSGNPGRGTGQHTGPGYIWQGAEKDRMEFVGPDASPYNFTLQHIQHLRDEMHRVVHQMAQAASNMAASRRQSGKAREMELQSEAIVSNALGSLLRELVYRVYDLVGRSREDSIEIQVDGFQDYDSRTVDSMVTEATLMEPVSIPSTTFHKLYKAQLAKKLIGQDLTVDQAASIDSELDSAITDEIVKPAPKEQQLETPDEESGSTLDIGEVNE